MTKRLRIVFDNSVVFAGQFVTGRVFYECKGASEAERKLELSWNGKEHVHWETFKQTHPAKVPGLVKLYHEKTNRVETDTITYFSETQYLMPIDKTTPILEFPFSYQLSPECMPNVKGKYGGIAYWVTAKIRGVGEISRGFNVLPSHQYEFTSEFLKLSLSKSSKGESGAVFKDGEFSMTATLEKRDFNRGETLNFSIRFENTSKKPIVLLQAELLQKIHFHAHKSLPVCSNQKFRSCPLYRNLRRTERSLVAVKKFRVAVPPSENFEGKFSIEIPSKTVPTFESPLISVGYFMVFHSKTSSIFSKLSTRIGITVGTKRVVRDEDDETVTFTCSDSVPTTSY